MASSRKIPDRFLVRTLGRRVSLEGLPRLQPIFALQILVGLSQALNGSAARAEALAEALILDGQRRLSELRSAAPHLSLSLEQLARMAHSDRRDDEDPSAEESAIQGLLEVCLGLLLQFLSSANRRSHPPASSAPETYLFCPALRFFPFSSPLLSLLRARDCLISQP